MSLTAKDLVTLFKKQPVGITCGFISVLLAATLYLRWDNLEAQEKARDDNKAEAQRLKNNLNNSKNLQAEFDRLAAANKEIQERAVQPKDASLNLRYFYQIEAATGVKEISTRQVGPVVPAVAKGAPPKTTYVPDAFTMMVNADFRQAVDFIRRVERGPRFSRFTNVVLASASRDADPGAKLVLTVNNELLAVPASPVPAGLPSPGNVAPPIQRKATLSLSQQLVLLQPAPPLAAVLKDPFNPPDFRNGEGPDPLFTAASPEANLPEAAPPPPRPPADLELLEAIAPTITPTGSAVFNGESLLLFGSKRLRVGDHLPIIYKEKPFDLIIAAIEGNSFTLRLNAEQITRLIKSSPTSKP
jgi:hypothetical protein